MPLFIIDFDKTIASQNTHNAVSEVTTGGIDAIWDVIKNIPPIGGAEAWQNTLRNILNQGHRLAIASFNAYGMQVIPRYLQEVIGLSAAEVEQIHIESWLPLQEEATKNAHIRYIISDMRYGGSPESIVLIDDELRNIHAAQKEGYRVVHATGNYLEKINSLNRDWNAPLINHSFFKKESAKDSGPEGTESKCYVM